LFLLGCYNENINTEKYKGDERMKIYQVDAFTNKPFTGNPAAVCILKEQKSDKWLLDIAKEMNLSETAFLIEENDGYRLRWFTPTVEENLCGHATLSAAHILWEKGYLDKTSTAKFYTRSGLLTAELREDWIQLDFPALSEEEVTPPEDLLRALQISPTYVGRSTFDYIVEVDSEEIVRNLNPDFTLLDRINARGVIVTSISNNSEYDFVSRFFAPKEGIPEDPVTGSAHCSLGPYWMNKLNKNEFIAYQASSRGGVLRVEVRGDRIKLYGQALTILEGELFY
jgi:PhzF family phenazine biosynthesis protein